MQQCTLWQASQMQQNAEIYIAVVIGTTFQHIGTTFQRYGTTFQHTDLH